MRYWDSGNDGFNYCPGPVHKGRMLKSMLSVLGWEFRLMPVMLCLAASDAHSPLLYSHNVLIRSVAARAPLHLCWTKRGITTENLTLSPPKTFRDAELNLLWIAKLQFSHTVWKDFEQDPQTFKKLKLSVHCKKNHNNNNNNHYIYIKHNVLNIL